VLSESGHEELPEVPNKPACVPSTQDAGHACGPRARGRRRKRPRILDTLDRAREFRALLEAGEVKTAAEIAKRYGVTRARVTQIMNVLRLAPEVLDRIEALDGTCTVQKVMSRLLV
jgi:hypothetical protein